jgi:deoxyguanosine kinase
MAYIVIEGVIGVGKTALTRLLGDQLGMNTVFEQFEENPF